MVAPGAKLKNSFAANSNRVALSMPDLTSALYCKRMAESKDALVLMC